MCGVTLKSSTTIREFMNRLDIKSVFEVARHNRLRWFGQVERKSDDDWVNKCQQLMVEGKAGRGRGRKT